MEWYFRNDQPIYTQLTQQITLAILSGSIPSGGRLPTVRELAAEAGVNPNTVQRWRSWRAPACCIPSARRGALSRRICP